MSEGDAEEITTSLMTQKHPDKEVIFTSVFQEVIGSRARYNYHVGVAITSNYYTKQTVSFMEMDIFDYQVF